MKGHEMQGNMMKAIRFNEFGGPEVLRYDNVPIPEPKPGEVLVGVHAVGINPADWYLRDGYEHQQLPAELRPSPPLPAIPGSDVSGVVEAVATDVQGFSVGEEVFGMLRFPSIGESAAYAEYVAAPASDLARKPVGIDHVHAAGAPMSGLSAWQPARRSSSLAQCCDGVVGAKQSSSGVIVVEGHVVCGESLLGGVGLDLPASNSEVVTDVVARAEVDHV
jgi:NADPH:quinone reductase-like Zn-dependent oxidoreductase